MKRTGLTQVKPETRFTFPLLLFALSLTLLSSCKKNDLCYPTFNAQIFEQLIKNAMEDSVMGYAYVIAQNGTVLRSGAFGKAQNSADGDIAMSVNLDMQVASISKFITSTLAIYICRDKGLPLTTAIGPYLPSGWPRGPGINSVTIAELISQTAGLNFTGTQNFNATRWDSLQLVVAAGASLSKTRRYTNTHAALLRVVLPAIWYGTSQTENSAATNYRNLVQNELFDKISITGDLRPSNGNQILAYTGKNDVGSGSGGPGADFTLVSGGIGWNLTCAEVAKFWAYAWYSDEFVDDTDKQWVKDNRADVWNTVLNAKYGNYYCKLGGWSFSGTPPNTKDMNSLVMLYPYDVQLTLFTNSPPPTGSLVNVAQTAYDNSFLCE